VAFFNTTRKAADVVAAPPTLYFFNEQIANEEEIHTQAG
jgi:hypothetical protein